LYHFKTIKRYIFRHWNFHWQDTNRYLYTKYFENWTVLDRQILHGFWYLKYFACGRRYVFIRIFSIEIKHGIRWISLSRPLLFLSKNIDRVRMQTVLGINFYANSFFFFSIGNIKSGVRVAFTSISLDKFSFIISSALGRRISRYKASVDHGHTRIGPAILSTIDRSQSEHSPRRDETMVESDERRTRSKSS